MSAHDVVYELLYQVVQPGDENQLVGKTSVIEFPANKTVAALEEAILQKLGEKLHGKEFDLWMLDPKLPSKERDLLKTIKFTSERLKELHPANRLSKYWQEAPHDGHLLLFLHDGTVPSVKFGWGSGQAESRQPSCEALTDGTNLTGRNTLLSPVSSDVTAKMVREVGSAPKRTRSNMRGSL
ncbi:hypothetical protein BT69DRAFT_1403221 [Atractiella rhizophila]|nr:hypothetical protein BT69DRAFT_1403221 [Atractiella rhizophila]